MNRMIDMDPVETREWLDSLHAVLKHDGAERASFLIDALTNEGQSAGLGAPSAVKTPYINTLPTEHSERANWDREIEHRIRSIIRWNAVAIILRANKDSSELGGHIVAFNQPRRFTILASVTPGTRRPTSMAAILFIFRVTPLQASTPALSWKAG